MADSPDKVTISKEERAAYAAQTESLKNLTEIAQSQFDISKEQMDRYTAAFQDPASAESREQLAELQSKITGTEVTAADLEGKGLEDLIRDTMVAAPAQFQREAENFIQTTGELADQFNVETTLNTQTATQALSDAGYEYQTELETVKEQLGTIDQKLLAQETGAATAGISTAFAEAQKGLQGQLAQRGLAGSGVEAGAVGNLATQEALTKFGALSQARTQARGLSDQIRLQRLGIAGQQFGAAGQTAQNIYGLQQGASQSRFQTGATQAGNVLSTRTAATQQGLGTLQQAQGAAQGQFWQGSNLLGQAGQSYGTAAAGFGSQAALQQQRSLAQFQAQTEQATATNEALAGIAGTALGAGIAASDKRLKDNIVKVGEHNGINIYTWTWNDIAASLGINSTPIGFIAQEVEEIFPEFVGTADNGYLAVNYTEILKAL
jgi:hypothetical protein